PARLRFLANVNPHLHDPLLAEVERQLALGAVALKLHPVHARFSPNDAVLWPVYARMEEAGTAVVFHCGTSVFPGALNRFADPGLVDEVAGAFPDLRIVLAHGGRGWWYAAAVADLGFDRDTLELIFWRNAFSVYALGEPPSTWE
ncbi:MAG TPA: amidohydrolase family protein, partial [Acidimicrobiia bacterium]|nr:amidohydrolase family protein [Acidimicrobiia bacterium]